MVPQGPVVHGLRRLFVYSIGVQLLTSLFGSAAGHVSCNGNEALALTSAPDRPVLGKRRATDDDRGKSRDRLNRELATGVHRVMTAEAGQQSSIGTATMEPDGTIVLQLNAQGPGGSIGDALLRYPPDHPQYHSVLDHLGGLHHGETKPVPPWD
jgi:hypothetical protein